MNKTYYLSLRKTFLFVTYFSYGLPINFPKLCCSFLVNHNGFPEIPESSQNPQNVTLKLISLHLLWGENSFLSIPSCLGFLKHIRLIPASTCTNWCFLQDSFSWLLLWFEVCPRIIYPFPCWGKKGLDRLFYWLGVYPYFVFTHKTRKRTI